MSDLGLDGEMVRGEGFALEDNFVTTLRVRLVERGHEQVKIGGQSFHDSDFGWSSPDNIGNCFGSFLVCIEPCWQRGVGQWLEMAKDTLRGPRFEVLVDSDRGEAWLKA